MHDYQRSPHSGAGNCDCGAAEHHVRHPHAYRQAANFAACVCTRDADDPVHTDAATAVTIPRISVEDAVRAARGGPSPAQVRGYA